MPKQLNKIAVGPERDIDRHKQNSPKTLFQTLRLPNFVKKQNFDSNKQVPQVISPRINQLQSSKSPVKDNRKSDDVKKSSKDRASSSKRKDGDQLLKSGKNPVLYYISPKEILENRQNADIEKNNKRHKPRNRRNSEELSDLEKDKNVRKLEKLLQKPKYKPDSEVKSMNKTDPEWPTKNEIFKLLKKSKHKPSSYNSDQLNQYFVFDKLDKGPKDKKSHEDRRKHKKTTKSKTVTEDIKQYITEIPYILDRNLKELKPLEFRKKKPAREDVMFISGSLDGKSGRERKSSKDRRGSKYMEPQRAVNKIKEDLPVEVNHNHVKNSTADHTVQYFSNISKRVVEKPAAKYINNSKKLTKILHPVVEIIPSSHNCCQGVENKKNRPSFQRYYKYGGVDCALSDEIRNCYYQSSSDSNRLYTVSSDQVLDTVEENGLRQRDDAFKSKIPVPGASHLKKFGANYKTVSGKEASNSTNACIADVTRALEQLSRLKEAPKDQDKKIMRITRDKTSSELKTTNTVSEIVENFNALSSFKHTKQSTTDINDSVSTTTASNQSKSKYDRSKSISPRIRPKILPSKTPRDNSKYSRPAPKDRAEMSKRNDKKGVLHSKFATTGDDSDKKIDAVNNSPTAIRSCSLDRCGDRSTISESAGNSPNTTLMLTKTYRDPDKITRTIKSKMYGEYVRKNLLKTAGPQVMEIRYLTIDQNLIDLNSVQPSLITESSTDNKVLSETRNKSKRAKKSKQKNAQKSTLGSAQSDENIKKNALKASETCEELPRPAPKFRSKLSTTTKVSQSTSGALGRPPSPQKGDCARKSREQIVCDLNEDLVDESKKIAEQPPCIKLVSREQFDELFQMPIDQSLNEILNENYHFLSKDFTYVVPSNSANNNMADEMKTNSQSLSQTPNEIATLTETNRSWYEFTVDNSHAISHDIALSELYRNDNCDFSGSDRHVLPNNGETVADFSSAAGSEESGYSTVNSKKEPNQDFFERPSIQALLKPQFNASTENCSVPKIFPYDYHNESKIDSCGLSMILPNNSTSTVCTSDVNHNYASTSSIDLKISVEDMPKVITFSSESICSIFADSDDLEPEASKQCPIVQDKKESLDIFVSVSEIAGQGSSNDIKYWETNSSMKVDNPESPSPFYNVFDDTEDSNSLSKTKESKSWLSFFRGLFNFKRFNWKFLICSRNSKSND